MAVPSTGQGEIESRAWLGLAWRGSWRSHLQGKERESGELDLAWRDSRRPHLRTGQREAGLAGLSAAPSTYRAERGGLGGTLGGPIYVQGRERRAWRDSRRSHLHGKER